MGTEMRVEPKTMEDLKAQFAKSCTNMALNLENVHDAYELAKWCRESAQKIAWMDTLFYRNVDVEVFKEELCDPRFERQLKDPVEKGVETT